MGGKLLCRFTLMAFHCALSGCASMVFLAGSYLDDVPVCFWPTTRSQVAVFYVHEAGTCGCSPCSHPILDAKWRRLDLHGDPVCLPALDEIIARAPARDPSEVPLVRHFLVKARIRLEKRREPNACVPAPPQMQPQVDYYAVIVEELLDVSVVNED